MLILCWNTSMNTLNFLEFSRVLILNWLPDSKKSLTKYGIKTQSQKLLTSRSISKLAMRRFVLKTTI